MQEDTLKFQCNSFIKIQVRILTNDGEAMASEVIQTFTNECLDDEVLE
jgi:hypothetical protein